MRPTPAPGQVWHNGNPEDHSDWRVVSVEDGIVALRPCNPITYAFRPHIEGPELLRLPLDHFIEGRRPPELWRYVETAE